MIYMENTKEVWKDIPGYEGYYQVSNLGRVKSLARKNNMGHHLKEKILKPSFNKGYPRVIFCKDAIRKSFFCHRLVAIVFIPNPNNYPIINHKDENPGNCCVENLEWCSYKYNNNYGDTNIKKSNSHITGKTGKKRVIQYDLDGNFVREWGSMMEAERGTGIKESNISRCCNGTIKKTHNYKWKYAI